MFEFQNMTTEEIPPVPPSSSNTKPQIVKLHSTNLHPEANQRHLFCHSRYIYIYICLQEFWWFQRVNRQCILKPPRTLQSLSQSCMILRSAQHHLPTLPSTKSIYKATEMGRKKSIIAYSIPILYKLSKTKREVSTESKQNKRFLM